MRTSRCEPRDGFGAELHGLLRPHPATTRAHTHPTEQTKGLAPPPPPCASSSSAATTLLCAAAVATRAVAPTGLFGSSGGGWDRGVRILVLRYLTPSRRTSWRSPLESAIVLRGLHPRRTLGSERLQVVCDTTANC